MSTRSVMFALLFVLIDGNRNLDASTKCILFPTVDKSRVLIAFIMLTRNSFRFTKTTFFSFTNRAYDLTCEAMQTESFGRLLGSAFCEKCRVAC